MLLKLWRDEKPDYLVVAFDAPTPTFRHRAFAEYKATRAKAPDAFRPQVVLVKQVLKTMGIPFWEIEGYEADDLMGAAVQQAKQKGLQVVLVTGDMDALQLVGDGVTVLMPKRGISEMERYDAERVKQEFGVPPELIPDLKGLAGDTCPASPESETRQQRGCCNSLALLKPFWKTLRKSLSQDCRRTLFASPNKQNFANNSPPSRLMLRWS
jgi:DNA polymerase-1